MQCGTPSHTDFIVLNWYIVYMYTILGECFFFFSFLFFQKSYRRCLGRVTSTKHSLPMTITKTYLYNVNPLNPTFILYITKTRLYNFDSLKLHFYIVNLGFTGVYIIFLIFAQKHRLWILVRTASPRRGGSNEYPQSMS